MKKLTLCQRIYLFFGYRYLVNNNTKEIHDLKHKHHNCQLDLMSKHNKFYGTKRDKDELMTFMNGCRWCMKEESTD